ncbi:MAG: low affinity iron permease family protein [bacterium]|nr:low affinity iron permease family protein [bacterium]
MINDVFRSVAKYISRITGTPKAFIFALLLIIAWLTSGPTFHYSDTWQLVINTTTTIITFLMVFLIQNTQNRDAKATQLKLDEIIHVMSKARNSLVNIEEREDEELEKVAQEFKIISDKGIKDELKKAKL